MIDEKPQIFGKENKKTTDKNGKQKGDLKNPPGSTKRRQEGLEGA